MFLFVKTVNIGFDQLMRLCRLRKNRIGNPEHFLPHCAKRWNYRRSDPTTTVDTAIQSSPATSSASVSFYARTAFAVSFSYFSACVDIIFISFASLIVRRFVMAEKEIRHVSSPLSAEQQSKEAANPDQEIEVTEQEERPVQLQGEGPLQPALSKARTIALVATLTGAAFLKYVND